MDINLLFIIIAVAALLLGILLGSITKKTKKFPQCIAEIEVEALEEIKAKFWHLDISNKDFAEMCQDIREEAWKDKEKLERRTLRLQKIKK